MRVAVARRRGRISALALGVALMPLAADVAAGQAPVPSYTPVAVESPLPEPRALFEVRGNAGDLDHDGVNDVIAAQNDNLAQGLGRVWVFSGDDRSVLLSIVSPEPQDGDGFGTSALSLGDVNGDGVVDFAIGAPGLDVGTAVDQGKVWVFSGGDGRVLYAALDPNPQPSAAFGAYYTTATGDLDGDGVRDFVELAPGETDAAGRIGAAYVFSGAHGRLLYRIANPGGGRTDFFEILNLSASDPGDVSGDGVDDIVVGASNTDVAGNAQQGRAFLLDGRNGAIIRQLDDPDPAPLASFGAMIANDVGAPGDVDGDGVRDIYVDADRQPLNAPDLGAAYLFSGRDGSLLRRLTSPRPERLAFFGFDFADASDLNGDGTGDLLVTQTGCCSGADRIIANGGSWVFDPRSGEVLVAFDRPEDLGAGQGIASPGDVNGDCVADFFIGAPRTGANWEGHMVVELSNGPSRCAAAAAPGPQPGPAPQPPARAEAGRSTAKLSLARATIDRRRRLLEVLAPITARASGRVRVELRAAGRRLRFSAPIDSADGRIRVRRRIPAAQARLGTGILTIAYGGDADTRPQTVRLRAANRPALLRLRRPRLVDGRLRASGTVSSSARGVVRVQLEYDRGGQTRVVRLRARIRGGRWAVDERLPATDLQGIAQRSGSLHSYTLFTGYLPARMRGEMRSFQVLGGG